MDPLFVRQQLNPEGKEKATMLATIFDDALTEITTLIGSGPSREVALVRTHLEQASFYAQRAMAIRPENQES